MILPSLTKKCNDFVFVLGKVGITIRTYGDNKIVGQRSGREEGGEEPFHVSQRDGAKLRGVLQNVEWCPAAH